MDFCVAVKLNSADFQRGGFDTQDAASVIQMLNGCGVDLVELSGGSYEAPAMQGEARDGRTLAREAYFLEFASAMVQQAAMPLMVTGGIRRMEVAQAVLAQGVAVVGMATALAYHPTLPRDWKLGRSIDGSHPTVNWKDKTLAALATMAMVKRQLQRMGAGRMPQLRMHALWSLVRDQLRTKVLTRALPLLAEKPSASKPLVSAQVAPLPHWQIAQRDTAEANAAQRQNIQVGQFGTDEPPDPDARL